MRVPRRDDLRPRSEGDGRWQLHPGGMRKKSATLPEPQRLRSPPRARRHRTDRAQSPLDAKACPCNHETSDEHAEHLSAAGTGEVVLCRLKLTRVREVSGTKAFASRVREWTVIYAEHFVSISTNKKVTVATLLGGISTGLVKPGSGAEAQKAQKEVRLCAFCVPFSVSLVKHRWLKWAELQFLTRSPLQGMSK